MIRDILVYLDGTPRGESAIATAAEIARGSDRCLIFLYVIVTPTLFAGVGTTELEPVETPVLTSREQAADAYLAPVAEAWRERGLEVECVIVQGPLEESIVTCARSLNIGLIALADYPGNPLTRLLAGSLAERLIKKTGLPVMAVNPDGRLSSWPAI
jgi:nucleotide-binding universal stress UspA family protein